MNPEMQQKVDEHIKKIVNEIHESYKIITSGLAKQASEAVLEARNLHSQLMAAQSKLQAFEQASQASEEKEEV